LGYAEVSLFLERILVDVKVPPDSELVTVDLFLRPVSGGVPEAVGEEEPEPLVASVAQFFAISS
jgi:hypothetical protein